MDNGIEVAKPFIVATTNILSTMAGVHAEAGKPYIKKGNIAKGDVSAVVGITGHKNGSISMTFTRQCAVAVVKGMLGDDIHDIVQDTQDAVGEVTNMVSGQARAALAGLGLVFQGATPTVVMGSGHTISHVTKSPVVAIPFHTEHGDFTIEFCFE